MNRTPSGTLPILLLLAAVATPLAAQQPDPVAARTRHGVFEDELGRITADGVDWRAEFARGATLEVPAILSAATTPRLELQFVGAGRSGGWLPADAAAQASRLGERVQYVHGGVVERYQVGATGFEQSFVFASKPAGHGDLVVQIGVGGNVTAPAAALRQQALEFSCDGARRIRYGEAVAFDRGGNRTPVATRYDGLGRIELVVPAAFVDGARYPLVVDPAVGPVLNPGGPSWNDTSPDVAYDLVNDTYMVVWERIFSSTNRQIRGELIDGDGVTQSGLIQVTTSGVNRTPSVAMCNSLNQPAFLVVWEGGGVIRGRMFHGNSGAALAAAFSISAPFGGEVDRRPDVSGPGDGAMMVVWDRQAAGQADPSEIKFRDLYWPQPAFPQTFSSGVERTLYVASFASGYARAPRIAESDVDVMVVGETWHANRVVFERFYNSPAPGDVDVFTVAFRVRQSPSALVGLDPPSVVTANGAVGPDEVTPSIGVIASSRTSSDVQYCIAWEDERDVWARMYDLAGTLLQPISVRATSNFEGVPAVGAGACEFTVGYMEIIPPAEFEVDVRAARVLRDGTVAITDRLVDQPGGPFQGALRAASRPIQSVANQTETNTTMLAWFGMTGPSGGINDIRARLFEPVVANESPFGVACPGPLGELPQIGTLNGPAIPGNNKLRITVDNAPTNSLAFLVVSDQLTTTPIPGAPGCSLYAGLPLLDAFPAVVNNSGFGSVILPIPCSVPSGVTLAFQWGVFTPGWNNFGWIVSDDLDISWSHF
jgi:hypothetical protein